MLNFRGDEENIENKQRDIRVYSEDTVAYLTLSSECFINCSLYVYLSILYIRKPVLIVSTAQVSCEMRILMTL